MKRSDFTASEYWEAHLALVDASLDASPAEQAIFRRKMDTLGKLQFWSAAKALERCYGKHPFYGERAAANPRYWRELAGSSACVGTRPDRDGFPELAALWAREVRDRVRSKAEASSSPAP